MIKLWRVNADDWRAWRELRLEALREAPYAYGSTLAQWQGDGDAETRWRDRLTSVPFNVIAKIDETPAGIVSGTALSEDGEVELISMWVAPFARGLGVSDALVQSVLEWSRSQNACRTTLSVVLSNAPAIALYHRHGFAEAALADGERVMILDHQILSVRTSPHDTVRSECRSSTEM